MRKILYEFYIANRERAEKIKWFSIGSAVMAIVWVIMEVL